MELSNLERTSIVDGLMTDREERASSECKQYKCQPALKGEVGLVGKSKTL